MNVSLRLVIALVATGLLLPAESAESARIRAAATRSVALLQRVGSTWYKAQTCTSCHHQVLPMIALDAARQHGIHVDETLAGKATERAFAAYKDLDSAIQYIEQIDPAVGDAYLLVAADAAGVKPSLTTAVYARMIAARQLPEGYWYSFDVRPPQSQSRFTATAVAARALKLYMPPQLQGETIERLARARQWFESNEPRNTEEITFRLLGLLWTGGDPKLDAERLLSQQRSDGGWAQLPGRASDAYATGEVLMALGYAQMSGTDAARRGRNYLLSTQKPDGSWHVVSRIPRAANVSPPYFESGFPYGHDQFISTSATAWATVALVQGLATLHNGKPIPAMEPSGLAWPKATLEAVLFGSVADLRQLLDGGLDPDAKTAEGTTLLMMAAGDPDKVKLLVERGANVKARAKSGFDAVIVAANYRGSANTLRYLFDHGAQAKAPAGVKIKYDATPVVVATASGDVEALSMVLDHGGDVEQRMILVGSVPVSPLEIAVSEGDRAVVLELLKHRADPNRTLEENGYTPLINAVLAGYPDVVQALISGGARLDTKDKSGMTALLYAASFNHGNADTLRVLLKAGADRGIREKSGMGATALAKEWGLPARTGRWEKKRVSGLYFPRCPWPRRRSFT